MILITTPDYLPQIGGLTTATLHLEQVLKNLGKEYRLLHWKNSQELFNFKSENYQDIDLVINIHFLFSVVTKFKIEQTINFINGSEILFTSSNPFKKIFKLIKKQEYLRTLAKAKFNIALSSFSQELLADQGFRLDYSRDLIFHLCMPTDHSISSPTKTLESADWFFCCVARDVPHKNIDGAVKFCELVQKITGKKVHLTLMKTNGRHSNSIELSEAESLSNENVNKIYQRSHFNLLLSLEQRKLGYVEGFGLTVLEAALFGTPTVGLRQGGLVDSIHHDYTGWTIDEISESTVREWASIAQSKYHTIAQNALRHTIESHHLNNYQEFVEKLCLSK